jgi:hypothetical protein
MSARREITLVAALLIVLAAVVYGRHIVASGFYYDDWVNAASYEFAATFVDAVRRVSENLGGRPVLACALAVPHALFGLNAPLHAAFAVALSILACLFFYSLLRAVGIGVMDAGAIAALALVFPWSDSLRLWPTGGINNVALCLVGAGLLLALSALRRPPPRSYVLHAGSALFYVLGVVTYEAVAPLVAISFVFYLAIANLGPVVRRSTLDIALSISLLGINVASSERAAPSLEAIASNVREFTEQFASLFTAAVVPVSGGTRASIVLSGVLYAVVACVLYAAARDSIASERLDRWLVVAGSALVVTAVAYVPYLASGLFPRSSGLNNRVNIVAAFGVVTLVYAVIKLGARWLAKAKPRRAYLANGFALAAVLSIAAAYAYHSARHARLWDIAAIRQDQILAVVGTQSTSATARSVFTFGHPAEVAPGVPILLESGDLTAAVRLTEPARAVRAYPVFRGARLACTTDALVAIHLPDAYLDETRDPLEHAYGTILFIDTEASRSQVVADRRSCRTAVRTFEPGTAPAVYSFPVPTWSFP